MCLVWRKVLEFLECLVLALGVVPSVVMVRVVKMVGLVAVVTVADDWVLNAFTLQLFLFVNSLQLCQQLSDEGLWKSTAITARVTQIFTSGSIGYYITLKEQSVSAIFL